VTVVLQVESTARRWYGDSSLYIHLLPRSLRFDCRGHSVFGPSYPTVSLYYRNLLWRYGSRSSIGIVTSRSNSSRADERTPLLTPSNDVEAARPVHSDRRVSDGPRRWTRQFDIIGTWVSLASAVLMICFGAASLIVARLWKPSFFSLGWAFMATFVGLMICVRYFLYSPQDKQLCSRH